MLGSDSNTFVNFINTNTEDFHIYDKSLTLSPTVNLKLYLTFVTTKKRETSRKYG